MAKAPEKPAKTAAKKAPAKKAAPKAATKKTTAKKTASAKPAAKPVNEKPAAAKAAAAKPARNSQARAKTASKEKESASTNNNASTSEPIWTKDPKIPHDGNMAEKVWRLIAMIAFAFIGYFALLAFIILAALQFIVSLLKSDTNPDIKSAMVRVKRFLNEIFDFLAYDSDEMPFPFRPFPADPAEK